MQMLRKTDIAVIVTDASEKDEETESFIEKVREKGIPYILVRNKCDLDDTDAESSDVLFVSAKTGKNIDGLFFFCAPKSEKFIFSSPFVPPDSQ